MEGAEKPLSRREMSCAIPPPPLFLEKIFCPALMIGESRDLGQGPGLDEKAKTRGNLERFPSELWARCGACPRFEIRADNRRFHNLFGSVVAALEHEKFAKVIGSSYRDAFSVLVGFRPSFLETSALSACLAFFDPRGFPLG